MTRTFLTLIFTLSLIAASPAAGVAQDTASPEAAQGVAEGATEAGAAPQDARAATGGAQTREDIMARQRGEKVDYTFRREAIGDPGKAAGITNQLGTLGGVSDPELWRALRYNEADITVSTGDPVGAVLMQDGGMAWLTWRETTLKTWGGYFLLGVLGLLLLFYLVRGKIRIDGEKTGETVLRFKDIERFGHWLLAGSFILLGITGLISLFGRTGLIPFIGKEAYATIALYSKWVHNNVSWAFMIGLVMIFVMWVVHNIPNRHDLVWLAKGGGLFSKGSHPPAKKFNAGQKIIFWAVIVLGVSISLSGLSLLFPFELPMFAKTFDMLNALGIPQAMGMGELQTALTPQQEMQLSQGWHAIVAFVFIGIIFAHIYLGSVGMEGAFEAMGNGEVEAQWAREHHSLWYEEVTGATSGEDSQDPPAAAPAE
ncbi:Formate dehydrogenase, cytochrome b556(fdo) subunit [Pseudoruegeria aquimaris]|uniref:Formate dehydrogenase, cytochrome b556(Fdo) subunit n=1 Tax=Pseudoruegeria aquimaris TaxID=393663 RepID=A0A1Y5S5U7_9RHOB|nr:formate dehydrogenase subunit gamma [Pseudoruegeria aquimaris]SLN30437.1 Formate dehydrogenase, cytochrome b556(fdo) subunit [Pseudoruegeria aquimaris]